MITALVIIAYILIGVVVSVAVIMWLGPFTYNDDDISTAAITMIFWPFVFILILFWCTGEGICKLAAAIKKWRSAS